MSFPHAPFNGDYTSDEEPALRLGPDGEPVDIDEFTAENGGGVILWLGAAFVLGALIFWHFWSRMHVNG